MEEAVKSISRSGTFAEDTNDPVKIAGSMEMLAESVHRALLRHSFLFKTVTLIVRYEDFSTYTRSKTVPVWTADIFVIKTGVSTLSHKTVSKDTFFVGSNKKLIMLTEIPKVLLQNRDV
jgi:DNA polymerase IV (DinB-like DNA polymerase)